MALDIPKLEFDLGNSLKKELDDALGPAPAEGDDHRLKYCQALAKAISKEFIGHILENLEIVGVEILVDPGTYAMSIEGGVGAPAVTTMNLPDVHTQSNDGTGLVK